MENIQAIPRAGSSHNPDPLPISAKWRDRHNRVQGNALSNLVWIITFLMLQSSCEWPGPSSIHITAVEFRFVPARVEWPPFAPVRLVIRNQGYQRHVFHSPELLGPDAPVTWHQPKIALQEANAVVLDPGQSIEFTVSFSSGVFPFRCWIKGHTGMEGVIIVQLPSST